LFDRNEFANVDRLISAESLKAVLTGLMLTAIGIKIYQRTQPIFEIDPLRTSNFGTSTLGTLAFDSIF
jgi:hypothetical protein